MTCPFLEYRASDDEHTFDHERPYCALVGEFVSPMQADICNDRYEYNHDEHCNWFREEVEEVTSSSR